MRLFPSLAACAMLLTACGGDPPAPAGGAPAAPGTSPPADTAGPAAPAGQAAPAPAAPVSAATPGQTLGGRTGELVNPDNNTMVFLYYDLAGITPPIDRLVEEDSRVKFAPGPDKASQRELVRAELEAGAAAARGIGVIRLSLNNANLSDYDPSYGEFMVRALAPSSVVDYNALGQKVSLKFANGRTAQIWRVPPDQAQAIRDKIGFGGNVELDALLHIKAVQPGPGGGTISTSVIEYEMRQTRTGTTIGRVQVPQ